MFIYESRDTSPDGCAQALSFLAALRFPAGCSRFVDALAPLDDLGNGYKLVKRCLQAYTLFDSRAGHEIALNGQGLSIVTVAQPICVYRVGSEAGWAFPGISDGEPGQPRHYSGPLISSVTLPDVALSAHLDSINGQNLQAITFMDTFSDSRLFPSSPSPWSSLGHLKRALQVHRVGMFFEPCLPLLYALSDESQDGFDLFPLLRVIVVHGMQDTREHDATARLTALVNLVRLRKRTATPLQQLVVSRAVEQWGVWAALRVDLEIKFM